MKEYINRESGTRRRVFERGGEYWEEYAEYYTGRGWVTLAPAERISKELYNEF